MMKIPPANPCAFFVADGEPNLRLVPLLQITGCTSAAHFCGDPARVDRVGENVGPPPCGSHAKHQHMELRIGIGDPDDAGPEALGCKVPLEMHAGAQLDQPLRSSYEARQNVWCQSIDGEYLFCRGLINAGVVNDGVKLSQCIHF